jgi:predicted RNA binding protein YcfA (HicA-like mRNA interferase family)
VPLAGGSRPSYIAVIYMCILIHTLRSTDIIAALEADGWREVARKGSHAQFKHPTKPGRVTVPHPRKDIAIGTLRSIERQAGIRLR